MKNKIKQKFIVCLLAVVCLFPSVALAQARITDLDPKQRDSDSDGLSDHEEQNIYFSNSLVSDTDSDGFMDGEEVRYLYDPNKVGSDKLVKLIRVSIAEQRLWYLLGPYVVGDFLVSTGRRGSPTPKGTFSILKKMPTHLYKGINYYYPNTKWNMLFKYKTGGNLYIHGAYWHNKFGQVMSGGCVNVSYVDMEKLYNWTDIGTQVVIQ